jgi:hypothetical protein
MSLCDVGLKGLHCLLTYPRITYISAATRSFPMKFRHGLSPVMIYPQHFMDRGMTHCFFLQFSDLSNRSSVSSPTIGIDRVLPDRSRLRRFASIFPPPFAMRFSFHRDPRRLSADGRSRPFSLDSHCWRAGPPAALPSTAPALSLSVGFPEPLSTPALLCSLALAKIPRLSMAALRPSRPHRCRTAKFVGFDSDQERDPMAPDPFGRSSWIGPSVPVRHRVSMEPPARKSQWNRGGVNGSVQCIRPFRERGWPWRGRPDSRPCLER